MPRHRKARHCQRFVADSCRSTETHSQVEDRVVRALMEDDVDLWRKMKYMVISSKNNDDKTMDTMRKFCERVTMAEESVEDLYYEKKYVKRFDKDTDDYMGQVTLPSARELAAAMKVGGRIGERRRKRDERVNELERKELELCGYDLVDGQCVLTGNLTREWKKK